MVDILNLALPYFGLIFIGFACGKSKNLPETGLAWMNFFLLYVSLPALLFGIMSKTPFAELNNPPFLIATTLGTASAFVLAMIVGRLLGRLSFREATLAGLAGAFGNIGYMGPGLALAVLGAKAAAPTALIFCCDAIFLFSIVPLLIELSDRDHPSLVLLDMRMPVLERLAEKVATPVPLEETRSEAPAAVRARVGSCLRLRRQDGRGAARERALARRGDRREMAGGASGRRCHCGQISKYRQHRDRFHRLEGAGGVVSPAAQRTSGPGRYRHRPWHRDN